MARDDESTQQIEIEAQRSGREPRDLPATGARGAPAASDHDDAPTTEAPVSDAPTATRLALDVPVLGQTGATHLLPRRENVPAGADDIGDSDERPLLRAEDDARDAHFVDAELIEELDADDLENVVHLEEPKAGTPGDDDGAPTTFLRRDQVLRAPPSKAPPPVPSPSKAPPPLPPPSKVPPPMPPAARGSVRPGFATTISRPPQGYHPPAPVAPDLTPAYALDPDESEKQLQDEGAWDALVELYRIRLGEAGTSSARANLLHRIASVLEHALGRPEDALGPLLEALGARPMDEAVVTSLERVAGGLGRMGEVAERARQSMTSADHESRTALLGHLVYWYERLLSRGKDTGPLVAELDRSDKGHPVALRRAAQIAGSNGDTKAQRELLLRALERSFRPAEKASLHVALAGAFAGTPDAQRHYEAALAHDPTNIVALQGVERLGRDEERYGQVEWSLARQIEIAPTDSERVRAILELALLHERKFLRRESAAELFERVLAFEPSQPSALEGLERCYHAMRDWARLAGVLRTRAEHTFDKRLRTQLLERAAEAYESKLFDLAAAVEVHVEVLAAEPAHKRALTDLARLHEKLGDWASVATYKARLAELAPSPKQGAVLLVQLGDMLSTPERDLLAARRAYERAVAVDPKNLAGWESLQRLAEQAGDDRRVAQCIEQRAANAPGPRQRAAALVELGLLRKRTGDERAAREAFEAAIAADPANELAALHVLEPWTREERWVDAADVCELLVNAAIRDRDVEAQFTRLRLATRIHAALAEADRAMSSSLAALELRPEDPAAQADLIAVTSQCRDKPQLVARAKPWLARMAETETALPPEVLWRLAELHRDAGDLGAAATMLESAREREPENATFQAELAATYLALGDFPRACKLKVDLARNAASADARFHALVEAGEIWARQARELEKAASVFEEARRIRPLDHGLLHTLMWLYGELEQWEPLSSVLEDITRIQESPDRKVKSLHAMAQVVRDRMKDPVRAAALLDELLDLDRTRLDVFEELVRTLTEVKAWDGLERSYRRMIARVKDDDEVGLTFALFQQLGLIYRDRIGDASRAYEALDAAARLRPRDAEVRKIITELLVVTDQVDNAVMRTRQALEVDPHDPELYAELYDLFLRQHAFDKAWCAANVVAALCEPTPDQRRFLLDYPPFDLARVPGQIIEPAWPTHLLHPDLDRTLTSVFALMTPAVARMRHAQLRPDQRVTAVGRPFTAQHSPLYEPIRAAFGNAADILGMRAPQLLVGDPSSLHPFVPALSPFGALQVTPAAAEARGDALVYMIGKRLAEQRPELSARAFFPSVPDLTALLSAAVRVSRQERARDAVSAQLDASLAAVMSPEERDGIRGIVVRAQMEGERVDVKRWSQAADLSSMRAALLLAGDVDAGRRSILAEPQSPADLPPREKLGELYKFAVSDLYSDLRGAIGVAVGGQPADE